MRYRKLSADGDMTFGRGQKDFWRDQPEGVAQAVATKLGMWQREWFLDITDGTPWETRVLGRYTNSTRDPAIRARILSTSGMRAISNYSSALDRQTRDLKVNAVLDTIYGSVAFEGPT